MGHLGFLERGGILEKGGGDLEKGGMTPLTNYVKFPELFIIGKYVKISFKNRGSPCNFLSSRGQKIKNITKVEQERLFHWFNFFMAFLGQKLIYTITI